MGFSVPLPLPARAVGSYPTVSPLPRQAAAVCFLWHFPSGSALKPPRPEVIRHRVSMEPGLSSSAAFRQLRQRLPGRLVTSHTVASPDRQGNRRYLRKSRNFGTIGCMVNPEFTGRA